MKFSNPKSKGFTLIELLVVVAIISLLSSIVLATLKDARDKARGTAFRQHVEEFKKAVELYRSDHNNLPNFGNSSWIAYTGTNAETDWLITAYGKSRFDSYFANYISDFPKPPFDKDSIYFRFSYEVNIGSNICGGTGYYLLIGGIKNIEFFDDWIAHPNSAYRCFPL